MLVRLRLYDIVAVDEQRIAFDQDREQPLVLEAESGAAVGQRIGRHRRRGVERLAHAAADIAIPAAGTALRVDLRHPPQPQFEGMHAAAVAARDKLDDPDQNFYENYICDSNRNYTHSCDRELDKLIDQQSAESDQEKRRRLVSEIDRRCRTGWCARSSTTCVRRPAGGPRSRASTFRSTAFTTAGVWKRSGSTNSDCTAPAPSGFRVRSPPLRGPRPSAIGRPRSSGCRSARRTSGTRPPIRAISQDRPRLSLLVA